MILLDVNLMITAHREDHPHHCLVRSWFDGMLQAGRSFTVPDIVRVGFVRIVTTAGSSHHRRRSPRPSSSCVPSSTSRATPPSRLALATPSCSSGCASEGDATGDLVTDAHLAALAIEHNCTLVSLDRDFARFENLRWARPCLT